VGIHSILIVFLLLIRFTNYSAPH